MMKQEKIWMPDNFEVMAMIAIGMIGIKESLPSPASRKRTSQ
jgi:hypothetical protein